MLILIISFLLSKTKLYVAVVTLSAKDNQKLAKLFSKGNEYQIKCENKNEYGYFLESNFVSVNRLFVLIYSNTYNNAKRYKARRYYLPKGIIKNDNITNGRNFYNQPTDSDLKQQKELES